MRVTELYVTVNYTPGDGTAPDASTLSTGTITSSSAQLSWTAPGDDGDTGTASVYDVRYATSPITEANWTYATQATGEPSPSVAGSSETFTVTGLDPGTTYYFAMKTRDEAPNVSALSNVVNATTFSTTISGTVYTDEGATNIGAGKTVRLIANGSSVGTDTTDGSGQYSLSANLDAGDALVLYIDGDDGATTDATTVTVLPSGSLTDIDLYVDHLITRHDNGGILTNALMNTALGDYSDTEILYSVTSGNLGVSGNGIELYIPPDHSFIPGADVTMPNMESLGTFDGGTGTVDIAGALVISGGTYTATSGTTTVGGDYTRTAGTFTHNSGTATFDATSGTVSITPGGQSFYNIIFDDNGGSTTFELQGALTVANDLTVIDGILDTKSGSNYAIAVTNDLDQSGGRVLANGSTITIGGDVTVDGSELSTGFNNAALVMTGTGDLTYTALSSNWDNGFNDLTVGQSGNTVTLQNTIAVGNVLTVGSGTLTGGSIYLKKSGTPMAFDANSTVSVEQLRFFATTQNIPVLNNGYDTDIQLAANNSTVTQLGAITLNAGKSLLIDGDGFSPGRTQTYVTDGYDLTVGGNIRVGIGSDTADKTLDISGSNIAVAGDIDIRSGTNILIATGSTVTLNGSADQTINSNGQSFNNLTLNNTGSAGNDDIIIADALDINGTLTITDGDLDIGTNDPAVYTAGDVTIATGGSVDVTGRTDDWTFDGTSTLTDSSSGGPQDLEDVVVNGTSLTLASSAKVRTMTVTTGTLDLGSSGYTLEIDGTGTPLSNSGTFTAGTSTVKYTGTTTATSITTLPYSSLQIAPTATTTYSLTGHLTGGNALTGSLTIDSNATLDVTGSNYNITLSGDWTNTGNFTAQNGTVTLNGTDQVINGSTTFYNVTKSVASADTLTFEAGGTTTVGGTVTLNGADGQLLTLASSTGSSAWSFIVTSGATKAISYVAVSWSDASGSDASQKPIEPTDSTDGGNNVDWFGNPVITVSKLSAVISDPINNTTNPKRIPGAVIEYTVSPSNSGDASPDTDSTVVIDVIDTTSVEYDATTGVTFTNGSTSSGLSLDTVSYSDDPAPGPYTYDYTPAPDGDDYDANVTSIKITTTGEFAHGGSPDPSFSIKYRVRAR